MSINSRSQTTIVGLDELIKAFMDLGEDALPFLYDAANKAGEIVLEKARSKVPVRTGNLKGKLKLGKAKKSSKYPYRVFSKVTTEKGAAYMVPLELGHRLVYFGNPTDVTVEPRPFLRPAADESVDAVISEIAQGMNNALEQIGGKK